MYSLKKFSNVERPKNFFVLLGSEQGFSATYLREARGFSATYLREARGFTIIELLVVFTVIAILSGVGIASFVSYSRSQELNQTSNDIKLFVTQAKFNSLNAVRSIRSESGQIVACNQVIAPNQVESLVGYSVGIIGTKRLELRQICTHSGSKLVKSLTLHANIDFASATPPATTCSLITFGSLSAVVSGVPCVMKVTGFGGQFKTLSLDAVGNVALQ